MTRHPEHIILNAVKDLVPTMQVAFVPQEADAGSEGLDFAL